MGAARLTGMEPGQSGAVCVPRLSVIVPTHERNRILGATLARLVQVAAEAPIEVIVVYDGEDEATAETALSVTASAPWPMKVVTQAGFGPAPKRNRGIAEAAAPVCLLIGDDALPGPDLVAAHLRFHEQKPERTAALLGLTTPAPPLDDSRFIRWLHREGAQFDYSRLSAGQDAGPGRFWTINVSVKTEFIRSVGGFDEGFPVVAMEDIECGYRLAAAGMRLTYEPSAQNHHFHPTDLRATLRRMRDVGVGFRALCERVPEVVPPGRPGPRHRLKAAVLTLAMAGGAPGSSRESTWRFVCDEMVRESYWGWESGDLPRIGRSLSRRAVREALANPAAPTDVPPAARL